MIKPFPYQVTGVDFLANGANQLLLADEMGLGKTPQLIWAAQKIRASRIHVVCPSVAKYNWQKEFKRFADIDAEVAGEGHTKWNRPVIITSFEYAKKYAHKYNQYPRDLLIIDEAHYLKEPTSARAKTIVGTGGLIHHASRTWFATGTPAPNHAGELWVLLFTFGITKLSYEGFLSRYCRVRTVPGKMRGKRFERTEIMGTNIKHSPELKEMLKLCCLRRLKKDHLDLPPLLHNIYYIEGDTDARILKEHPDLKEKLNQEYMMLTEKLGFNWGSISDERLLSALMIMGQAVPSLRRYHGLKKVRPVAELIREELRAGEYKKIIVFGIHRDVLETLAKELSSEFGVLLVTGKMSAIQKFEAQELFQNSDKYQIWIGNIIASGTNLTLTAANQEIFIEDDWVPGNNKQAADRAHRFSQTEAVNVRHIAIKNSLDEKITASLTRKVQEISTFID